MKRRLLALIAAVVLLGCAGQRREDYIRAHPELSPDQVDDIKNGRWEMGMTPEQVIASIGKPDSVNRSVGTWGIHEQWVYRAAGDVVGALILSRNVKKNVYLYFENGKLTSWQN